MKYRFLIYSNTIPSEGNNYKIPHIDVEAENPQVGWSIVKPQLKEGERLFCWYGLDKEDSE